MNKTELVAAIAERADLPKTASLKALNALLETIVSAVAKGEAVSLTGFGSFKPRARAARTGKNPRTGEKVGIAAKTTPKFSAGTPFKAAVAALKGKKKSG